MDLPSPALDIDYLLTPFEQGAAAPMLDDLHPDVFSAFFALNNATIIAATFLNPVTAIAGGILVGYMTIFAPDIIYNYGGEQTLTNGGIHNSDFIKNTMYHELGHAQHFKGNGSSQYWEANILYVANNVLTFNNAPYGNSGDIGSERCGVIEAWGNQQGFSTSDWQYGLNHSMAFGGVPTAVNSHSGLLERFSPQTGFPLFNDSDDSWIPKGLFHDCIDNNTLNPAGLVDPVIDAVKGFSHMNCFNSILNSPTQVSIVENTLGSTLPQGNNILDLFTLFNEYGF